MKKIYNEVTGDLEMTMEKRQTEARSLKREGYFVVEVRMPFIQSPLTGFFRSIISGWELHSVVNC